MADVQLILINLDAPGTFVFQFFPAEISVADKANWMAQETTIGVKPLFYANREPRRISFDELWLDNTDTNQSLTPQIKELRALLEETDNGAPPALLAAWGDRHERCVLEELTIKETYFNFDGCPIRVAVRLSLLQLQPAGGTSSGVRILPDETAADGGIFGG